MYNIISLLTDYEQRYLKILLRETVENIVE
jgi:hypothetical protein